MRWWWQKKREKQLSTEMEDHEPLFSNDEDKEQRRLAEEQAKIPWYKRPQPWFCATVTIIDIIMLIVEISLNKGIQPFKENPMLGPDPTILNELGAKNAYEILNNGQWWRLVTPIFLHVGILHLCFNMIFQVFFCFQIERGVGSIRFGIIYIISGIGSFLSSAIFLPHLISVGASGALFGIIGSLLASNIKNWGVLDRPCYSFVSVLFVIVFNLLIGTLPLIDNFCHLGGLVVGFFMGCILIKHVRKEVQLVSSEEKTGLLSINDSDKQDELETPWQSQPETEVLFIERCFSVKNSIFMIVGVMGVVTFFAVGLYVFVTQIDAAKWCEACEYVQCTTWLKLCREWFGGNDPNVDPNSDPTTPTNNNY